MTEILTLEVLLIAEWVILVVAVPAIPFVAGAVGEFANVPPGVLFLLFLALGAGLVWLGVLCWYGRRWALWLRAGIAFSVVMACGERMFLQGSLGWILPAAHQAVLAVLCLNRARR